MGRAVAQAMVSEGAHVIATGLTEERVGGFSPMNERARAGRLDVHDDAAVRALANRLSRLEVLIQCAGTILRGGQEQSPEGFATVVDVNLSGTMRVCSACVRRVKAKAVTALRSSAQSKTLTRCSQPPRTGEAFFAGHATACLSGRFLLVSPAGASRVRVES